MSEKMTLTFHSPIMEEVERGLLSEGLEQRKEAFKDDEELMKETTRFVADVIESATTEASRRKCQKAEFQADEGSSLRGGDRIRGWNSRARGFCNRILNAVCPCITTNDCFGDAPTPILRVRRAHAQSIFVDANLCAVIRWDFLHSIDHLEDRGHRASTKRWNRESVLYTYMYGV
nr:uncharacterized protein LOC124211916 isoform X1 [Neodiprion pinetum]XP_046467406.1 uncharacterized protein LOC124211916 isoform X1 [Neodiprion pinetum]